MSLVKHIFHHKLDMARRKLLFELLGMHALVHLSGPVLPRFCCWLPIHHSMKCAKTIFTTCNITLILHNIALKYWMKIKNVEIWIRLLFSVEFIYKRAVSK
jgi:hypothetical protein